MKPAPISRGSLYRLPSGLLVRATVDRGGSWFGRPIVDGREGEPTTAIPPDATLVRAYEPPAAVSAAAVDPLTEVRR